MMDNYKIGIEELNGYARTFILNDREIIKEILKEKCNGYMKELYEFRESLDWEIEFYEKHEHALSKSQFTTMFKNVSKELQYQYTHFYLVNKLIDAGYSRISFDENDYIEWATK